MNPQTVQETRTDAILDVVLELLEHDGYDGVQVRIVARRARASLATLYKLFGTRDEMIVVALERWMDERIYPLFTPPEPDESVLDVMQRVVHTMFRQWEQHPRMLAAYWRARTTPGGRRLEQRGLDVVATSVGGAFDGIDPVYLDDIHLIHSHVLRAAVARFANGEIDVSEIVAISDRTLYRLIVHNDAPVR